MVGETVVSLAVELRADDCCPIVDSPVALADVVVVVPIVSLVVDLQLVAVVDETVVLLAVELRADDCCPIVDSPVALADVVVPVPIVSLVVDLQLIAVVGAVVVSLLVELRADVCCPMVVSLSGACRYVVLPDAGCTLSVVDAAA